MLSSIPEFVYFSFTILCQHLHQMIQSELDILDFVIVALSRYLAKWVVVDRVLNNQFKNH